MIDYERIISRIQTRVGCSRDEGWTALSHAYLTCDKTRNEAEQSEYLYITASLRAIRQKYVQPREISLTLLAGDSSDDELDWTESLFVAPREVPDDNDYIIHLVSFVPQDYRIALAVVVRQLLSSRCCRRGPLTVEMTRQYLKRAGVPNATKMARQVYTFLTTMG